MTTDEAIVFLTLGGALALFMIGRPRYDVVAVIALLVTVLAGVVDAGAAFSGFGHPAVITVAAVLAISRGLERSGVVDVISGWLERAGQRVETQVPAVTGTAIPASAFMNNVGALALLMPVAIRIARKANNPPSLLLMPLAFASLLGGLITLIGTPPNIIIATFRDQNGDAFRMFDFTPVGLGVAVAGGLFISLIGWRLIPARKGEAAAEDLFEVEDYLAEVRIPAESKMAGRRVRDVGIETDGDVLVVSLIRGETRQQAPSGFEMMEEGDVLIVEADSDGIKALVDELGMELVGSMSAGEAELGSDDIAVAEVVVTPNSLMVGRTPVGLNLRWRFGINLLAVARRGERLLPRLNSVRFQPGDVLLVQARKDTFRDALSVLGCLPLAERDIRIGEPRRLVLAVGIFVAAIVPASIGLVEIQVAFVAAVAVMVVIGILSVGDVYDSIDWPVIVLLGAMIPVGDSLASTGGAERVAGWLVEPIEGMSPIVAITLLLILAMLLSDVVNNAAAAVVLAPVGIGIAEGLDASIDPFLMAVAVGASSAFLTPIGHQSNTLVMGPGGYRFSDYWRMGLPLEAIIVAVAVPLIVVVWPP